MDYLNGTQSSMTRRNKIPDYVCSVMQTFAKLSFQNSRTTVKYVSVNGLANFCAWSGFPDVYSAPGASFCFLVSERQNKFMESSSYLFCPFCHPLISFLLSQRRQLIDQVAFSPGESAFLLQFSKLFIL